MSAAEEQARASLEIIREQITQLSAPSPDEMKVIEAASAVLMTVGHGDAAEPDVRQLLAMAGDILTATPAGKAVEHEITAGAIARSHSNWMVAIQILGTFLQNMRDVVCDGQAIKGMVVELHLTPSHLNMLIGLSVATRFGLSSRACKAVAALLVMVVDKATYRTFCQMTDAQVIEKILHSATFG